MQRKRTLRIDSFLVNVVAFIAIHLPLGYLMASSELLATAHAGITFLVALTFALRRNVGMVAACGAYIAGAEVLWRMTEARVFWEFGKYATILIFVLLLLRMKRPRMDSSAFLYVMLLLPSVFLTLVALNGGEARKELSFNLSGPVALAVSVWFFRNVRLEEREFHRVLLALGAPSLAIAAVAIHGIATAPVLRFGSGSNKLMSGGFSPNQVAAALALGALGFLFYTLHDRVRPALRMFAALCAAFVMVQSVMTFTRGGLYTTGAAIAIFSLYAFYNRRTRLRVVGLVSVFVVGALLIVVPRLDTFTGGKFTDRFTDTGLTDRDQLAEADMRLFEENPFFGVGPGMAMYSRGLIRGEMAAHTEFTRLLAEHGLLGACSMLILFAIPLYRVVRQPRSWSKALATSCSVWALLYMAVNAMRIVAPSFLYGFACVSLLPPRPAASRVPVAAPPVRQPSLVA